MKQDLIGKEDHPAQKPEASDDLNMTAKMEH